MPLHLIPDVSVEQLAKLDQSPYIFFLLCGKFYSSVQGISMLEAIGKSEKG